MIRAPDAIPPDWTRHIGVGRIGLGHDVATTDKKSSNPSSLTVTEELSGMFYQRLIVRWKTPDPDIAITLIESVFKALAVAHKNQLRRFCIDASNERYHAQNLRKEFRKFCPVDLVVSGEALDFDGQRYNYKTLLGDLYVSAFEDGAITLPPGDFIVSDHRLVKKQSGGYVTEVDDGGNHGDTFDSGKLSYWSLVRGSGPVRAHAVAVGSFGSKPKTAGRIGPISRAFRNRLNS